MEWDNFETPVPITNAKKCEAKTTFEEDEEWADNKNVNPGYVFAGGEGTLTTLGLTAEEQTLIFGNTLVKGGVLINSADVAPQGAFLFARKKKRSNARHYTSFITVSARLHHSSTQKPLRKGKAQQKKLKLTLRLMR